MFAKNVFCNINKVYTDENGRVIICDLDDSVNEHVTLAVVYAPNRDIPAFFEQLKCNLELFHENKIIVGDFNLVLDVTLDRYRSNHNNYRACRKLKEIMETYYLTDVWRDRNPSTLKYSWTKQKPFKGSRIDFTLVSRGLDQRVKYCTYLQGILTDHCAIYLSAQMSRNSRGTGYWKLNSSILQRGRNKEVGGIRTGCNSERKCCNDAN